MSLCLTDNSREGNYGSISYDEEKIESEFLNAFDMENHLEMSKGLLFAWNQLWELMTRENNFSNALGSEVLDWQIGEFDYCLSLYEERWDAEDLYREMGDEYNALKMKRKADICYALEDEERKKKYTNSFSSAALKQLFSPSTVSKKKIYSNDPCSCGSGKKWLFMGNSG